MITLILIIALIAVIKYEQQQEEAEAMMEENLKNNLKESEELYSWNSRKN